MESCSLGFVSKELNSGDSSGEFHEPTRTPIRNGPHVFDSSMFGESPWQGRSDSKGPFDSSKWVVLEKRYQRDRTVGSDYGPSDRPLLGKETPDPLAPKIADWSPARSRSKAATKNLHLDSEHAVLGWARSTSSVLFDPFLSFYPKAARSARWAFLMADFPFFT